MVSALDANLAAFLAIVTLGVGLLLAAVSAVSWRRIGHRRLVFVTLALGVLALHGAWATRLALAGGSLDLVPEALVFATVLLLYASVTVPA
ncbi:MAG: hypothetical protein LC624_00075 [Halobacteriales archaeon]|nr:hypothetical protein [Halobacteriales archaeon]